MLLIANRQLCFGGRVYQAGEEFEVLVEAIAADLINREVARRSQPPQILYETKPARFETPTVQAPEVSTREPFRDVPVSDQEPERVASEGDIVLSKPNISEQGNADSRRRRRRARFGAGG